MTMVEYMLIGGAGGALIEAVAFFNRLGEWRAARLTPTGNKRRNPPSFLNFIDLPPVVAIAVARLVLGGAAATAYGTSGQATGALGALTVGAAAPALLQQLGQIRQIREAVTQPAAQQPGVQQTLADTSANMMEEPAPEAAEEGGIA
ncbi:hypothetical protein ABT404_03485 [Streptomyces hyaluromycini]|uniref:Uncharacterized protein n=1 Tax=Streptomyces hyaluromycini TaxID=1377993 RepID=A0ABV1WPY1_9ACTN